MWQKKIDEWITNVFGRIELYYMWSLHEASEVWNPTGALRQIIISFWSQHFRFESYLHDEEKKKWHPDVAAKHPSYYWAYEFWSGAKPTLSSAILLSKHMQALDTIDKSKNSPPFCPLYPVNDFTFNSNYYWLYDKRDRRRKQIIPKTIFSLTTLPVFFLHFSKCSIM